MGKSIFDVPPLKPSERKAYKKFASKMNALGYTQRLASLMTATLLGEEINQHEWDDLMLRVKLEEMGIDSTNVPPIDEKLVEKQ